MVESGFEYFDNLGKAIKEVVVTSSNGEKHGFSEAIDQAIRIITEQASSGGKVVFIGNGGSAAISSHMAIDFSKNAGIRALAFNDSSLLTCLSNDYGYEHVFEKSVEISLDSKDVLVGISSSGSSKNILRGVSAARTIGAKIVTFSGFDKGNPLRKLGDINFYVPRSHYGQVEISHLSICHCLVDLIIERKNG